MDRSGNIHGEADSLTDARERRERADTDHRLFVVREERAVVPDGSNYHAHRVADLTARYEGIHAARDILTAEADSMDAFRPHRHEYLYDVAEGIRNRADAARDTLLDMEARSERTRSGGEADD